MNEDQVYTWEINFGHLNKYIYFLYITIPQVISSQIHSQVTKAAWICGLRFSILAASPLLLLTLSTLTRVLHSDFSLHHHQHLSTLGPSSLPERSANSPSHSFKSKCSPFSLKLQTILVPYHNICDVLLNILCSIVPGKRIMLVKEVLTPNSMSKREKLLYWSAELALWTQVRKETFSWMTFMLLCQELCSLNGCLWVTLGNQPHLQPWDLQPV